MHVSSQPYELGYKDFTVSVISGGRYVGGGGYFSYGAPPTTTQAWTLYASFDWNTADGSFFNQLSLTDSLGQLACYAPTFWPIPPKRTISGWVKTNVTSANYNTTYNGALGFTVDLGGIFFDSPKNATSRLYLAWVPDDMTGWAGASVTMVTPGTTAADIPIYNPTTGVYEPGQATNTNISDTAAIDYHKLKMTPVAKTANYTLTGTDDLVLCATAAGSLTLSLPAAASHSGRVYTIIKTDSSVNPLIIDPNGSETINGSTTLTYTKQYDFIQIVSDGTNWLKTDLNFASLPVTSLLFPGGTTFLRADGTWVTVGGRLNAVLYGIPALGTTRYVVVPRGVSDSDITIDLERVHLRTETPSSSGSVVAILQKSNSGSSPAWTDVTTITLPVSTYEVDVTIGAYNVTSDDLLRLYFTSLGTGFTDYQCLITGAAP